MTNRWFDVLRSSGSIGTGGGTGVSALFNNETGGTTLVRRKKKREKPIRGELIKQLPFDVDPEMLGNLSQLKQPIMSYWNGLYDWVNEAIKRIEGIMAVEDTASMTELGGMKLQLNDKWKQKVETLVRNMNSDNTLKPTFMTSQRKQGALQYLRETEGDLREMLSIVNAIDWNKIESVKDVEGLFRGTHFRGTTVVDWLDTIYLERDAELDMEFDPDNLASITKVIEQTGEPISEMPPREDFDKTMGKIASALKQHRRTEHRYQTEKDFTDKDGRPTDIWGEKGKIVDGKNTQSLEGRTEPSVVRTEPEEYSLEWWEQLQDQTYPENT